MPLTTRFHEGDRVYCKTRRQRGEITRLSQDISGEQYYQVRLTNGDRITISVQDLTPVRDPLERLAAGDWGYAVEFDLLTRATALSFAYRYEKLSCLSNSRLEPKPYQIFVAHRVLQDLHPRYMLADEVGLGKTIEAGMILKELRARGLAERVLIVVPASLREQWKGEMDVKFNEQFHIYTGATIRENLRRHPSENPWARDKNIIASLPFARLQTSQELQVGDKASEGYGIDEADWDLVIFDEAHHLRRYLQGETIDSKRRITKSYRLGEALAERAKSLLLLTAVPLQLSRYETYSLVELLDSTLFPSFDDFQASLKRSKTLAELVRALEQEDSKPILVAFLEIYSQLVNAQQRGQADRFWRGLMDSALKVASAKQRKVVNDTEQLMQAFNQTVEAFIKLYRWGRDDEETVQPIQETLTNFETYLARHGEILHVWAEEEHKLSRIMIRNRKREVLKDEMVDRQAHTVPVNLTPTERALYHDVSNYIRKAYERLSGNQAIGLVLTTFRKLLVSSPHALAASLERRVACIEEALEGLRPDSAEFTDDELEEISETLESTDQLDDLLGLTGGLSPAAAREEVNTLRDLAARARSVTDPCDSKARELLSAVETILEHDAKEKVLIFTQFLETQAYLRRLFEQKGYRVAIFRGESGSSNYSKQEEFRRFKQDPNVRVMISTRVGGEGLNFQFCHIMFNYDLPWNPMRIEQRIGRLDRIGQERNVQVYNFSLEGTLDGRILTVLQDRIQLFERTIGNLDPILGEDIEDDIENIVLTEETRAKKEIADWEERIEERIQEAREAEEKMADFILDERSFRRDTVDEILGREPPVSNEDIEAFALDFLSRYPNDSVSPDDGNLYAITVPPAFRKACDELYGISLRETYTGTFDPRTAIEQETVDFFAFGHPLFDAMIRFCTDDEMKNRFDARNALRVLQSEDYAGYEGVQFNYILRFDGVRTYKKLIPIVLDLSGNYNEVVSDLALSLTSRPTIDDDGNIQLSQSTLQNLEAQSQEIVVEIADHEMEKARQRNKEDYRDEKDKLERLFNYRLVNQEVELERRQERLEDARRKGQNRILPALEGKVRATERRIEELNRQRNRDLEELNQHREVILSIELLNVAYVRIQTPINN